MSEAAGPHQVRIALAQPADSYRGGDTVRGTVELTAQVADECRSLSIQLQFFVHGRIRKAAVAWSQSLFSGPLQPGDSHRFPFEVELPRTSCPYRGHLLNIELRLAAVYLGSNGDKGTDRWLSELTGLSQSELRATEDPVAMVVLDSVTDPRPVILAADPERVRKELRGTGNGMLSGAVLLVLAAVALVCEIVIHAKVGLGFWSRLGFLAGGGLVGLVGLGLVLANFRTWMAAHKLGTPAISVVGADKGAEVTVRVRANARLSGASATVKVLEFVEIDAGSSTAEFEHEIADRPFSLEQDEAGVFRGFLPAEAIAGLPPEFGFPDARILWRLALHIQIDGWPDWRDTVPIEANPGGQKTTIKGSRLGSRLRR